FDQGSGTTVADASGNNLTGNIAGATWTTQGKYGNALSFNGTSSYVDFGNPALLQLTGSMTWSAWVNAAANPPDDGQIIAKSNGTNGWQLKTSPDTGPHTFGICVSSGGTRTQRYSTTVRSLNTWYHVVGVYNATAQTLDIYVNGVLDNGTLNGTVRASQDNAIVNVNIGKRTADAWGSYYFNGIIDEVRVYNRALTQAEIQSDMNTPLSSPAAQPTIISFKAETKDSTIVVTSADEEGEVSVQPAADALQDEEAGNASRGSTAVFTVAAIGGEELSYQWQKDDVDIPGANTPSYTLMMKSSTEMIRIRCVASNSFGTATTGEAIITRAASSRVPPTLSGALPMNATAYLLPTQYTLEQNYPNPFNPTTTFKYAIPKESYVRLQVFNLLGEVAATLEDQLRAPGYYELTFDAMNLASGVYIYRLIAGPFIQSKKMLLLR
ncbi:MAG: hypothetical protein HW389_1772, partial [Bacteroidetes bacterium]|nr:hypothetical protein [Bacteroidota bacterium]